MRTVACSVATALLLLTAVAHAVPRHERVTIKPIKAKDQASGKPRVVGFKVKMTLSTIDSARFPKAHVGLVDPTKTNSLTREQAADRPKGTLHIQFPEVDGVKVGEPREVEFEVKFGDGNTLKPGDRVDVISAWPVNGTMYGPSDIHVFGAVTVKKDGKGELELPKDEE